MSRKLFGQLLGLLDLKHGQPNQTGMRATIEPGERNPGECAMLEFIERKPVVIRLFKPRSIWQKSKQKQRPRKEKRMRETPWRALYEPVDCAMLESIERKPVVIRLFKPRSIWQKSKQKQRPRKERRMRETPWRGRDREVEALVAAFVQLDLGDHDPAGR